MQNLRTLFRPMIAVPALFIVVIVAGTCVAQSAQRPAPAAPNATAPAQPEATAAPVPDAEEDTDSADIPPFARGRISEAEYFALRDQEIQMRRGLDDLMRNPHARAQAIRNMEFQEQFLRRAVQGLTPLSAVIAAPSVPSWTPLGPDPIPNGQTSPSEVAVSGRVT